MGHEPELARVLAEVRRIEAYSKRLVSGVMAGLYSSVFRGTGIEFDEVREYETGDDPRFVDWAVTARVGRPFVKRFVDERQRAVVFVLDLSASMSGGIGPWSARGAAARIIGSLGLAAVASNDLVGLIACGERVERVVPLRKNVRHALRLVRDALVLRAGGDRTDLSPGLEAVVGRVQQRAVVFVISDFLCDGWRSAMARCARRHDVIAVRLGTPELSAPAAGLVRLRDPEGAGEHLVDFAHEASRSAYEENVARWRERTEVELRRAGAELLDIPLPSSEDPDALSRALLEFFRRRERRRVRS